jgi:hypothetical protein
MTEVPGSPPPASPSGFPEPPPRLSVPPAAPAALGRPSLWQAALLFLAFGVVAGGSCAAFLNRPNADASVVWAILFFASLAVAAGALTLLLFRIVRRRVGEAWPGLGQSALIMLAGAVLAAGGCGGWAVTMDTTFLVPLSIALFIGFVVGVALVAGAVELFGVAIVRLILKRPGAR